MAGYSDTPLIRKLGIKPAMRVGLIDPPPGFPADVSVLPTACRMVSRGRSDYLHGFFRTTAALRQRLPGLVRRLEKDGMLWLSWPKKTSGQQRDLDEATVRAMGLAAGLVDVKICAVDEVWSGLKFVWRLRDR